MNNEILLLRKLLVRLLRSWPVVIVAVLLWSVVGGLVMMASPEFYQSKVSLLVEEPYRMDDPQRWILGEQRFNEPGRAYIVNEGIRMKELSLMQQTCDSLQLGISYKQKGFLTDKEIYKQAPFQVLVDTVDPNTPFPTGIAFEVKQLPNGSFQVSGEGEYGPLETNLNVDQVIEANEKILLGGLSLCITPVKERSFNPDEEYLFELVNTQELALELVDAVEIDAVQLESSIFTASILASPKDKGKDILKVLSTFYVRKKLKERRTVLLSTLSTIQTEIEGIKRQLDKYENEIERYKSQTEINSTEEAGKSLLERIASLEMLRTDLQTRQEYLSYLNENLGEASGSNSLVMPSAYGLSDQGLNQLVADFNSLVLKTSFYQNEGRTQHPAYAQLTSEVAAKAQSIGVAIKGFEASNSIRLTNLQNQLAEARRQSAELPYQQMELLRKDRSFHALDANYRALNQRRVEAGIALASLSADVKVIERAYNSSMAPIFPDPTMLAIFVVLLSLGSPFLYLLFKTLLGKSPMEAHELSADENSVHSLRAGDTLSFEQLKNNVQSGNAQDLRKLGNALVQSLTNGPQIIALSPSGKGALLNQDMDMLLKQIDVMGVPSLCLDFRAGNDAFSYRDSMHLLETQQPGNYRNPLQNDSESVVSVLPVHWLASDHVKATDRQLLSTALEHFELIILLLNTPEELPATEALQSLSDIRIAFLSYGSTYSAQIRPSAVSDPKEMLVLSSLPPKPFEWREWWYLVRSNSVGVSGVTKMLFNRI